MDRAENGRQGRAEQDLLNRMCAGFGSAEQGLTGGNGQFDLRWGEATRS